MRGSDVEKCANTSPLIGRRKWFSAGNGTAGYLITYRN